MSTSPSPKPRLRSRVLATCALVAWVARSLWRDPRVFSVEVHTIALLARFEQLVQQHRISPAAALESTEIFERVLRDTKTAQQLVKGSRATRRANRLELARAIHSAQENLERLRTLSDSHA